LVLRLQPGVLSLSTNIGILTGCGHWFANAYDFIFSLIFTINYDQILFV